LTWSDVSVTFRPLASSRLMISASFCTASTFVMWRAHLDVPKPDLILDSSRWHLLQNRSADPPPGPFLHRRACEEICSVLHAQNGPGLGGEPSIRDVGV
jgi:hypothetical protein